MRHLLTTLCLLLLTTPSVSTLTKSPRSHKRLKKIFPMGYQTKVGALFAGVCVTKHGTFPAKITRKKRAYFSFNGKVMRCRRHRATFGVMLINQGSVPKGCRPRGFDSEKEEKLWIAVHMTPSGLIPGSANESGVGTYTVGKNVVSSGTFYWVC